MSNDIIYDLNSLSTGYFAAPFTILTTEINALGSGSAATSGSSYSTSNTGAAPNGKVWFKSGGSFTPVAGQSLWGWFLTSTDGGTTFESAVATPSVTVAALSRTPDFIIPLDNAAFASGNIRYCSGIVTLPSEVTKVLLQNTGNTGGVTALPSTGNTITVGAIVLQVT